MKCKTSKCETSREQKKNVPKTLFISDFTITFSKYSGIDTKSFVMQLVTNACRLREPKTVHVYLPVERTFCSVIFQ